MFLRAFGAAPGRPVVFTDPGGQPFVADQALFRTAGGERAFLSFEQLATLPLVARAIRYPDEIREVWGGVEKAQLRRRYVARMSSDGEDVAVVVDAAVGGSAPNWAWSTSRDPGFDLGRLRTGVLVWARPSAAGVGITAAERRALKHYTGHGHATLNAHLRRGEHLDPDEIAMVDELQGLLGRAELPHPMVLHRYIDDDGAIEVLGLDLGPGSILIDDGFMSTSRDPAAAKRFSNGGEDSIHLVIQAPAGIRALDVSQWSSTDHEHEVLFARGSRLKVVSWDDETRTLTVEALD